MVCSLWQRPLRRNDFLIPINCSIWVFDWRINVARVDIVRVDIAASLPPRQLHPAFIVSENIRVPVPLLVVTLSVLQQMLNNLILLKKLIKDIVLFGDVILGERAFVFFQEVRHFLLFHVLWVALYKLVCHVLVFVVLQPQRPGGQSR